MKFCWLLGWMLFPLIIFLSLNDATLLIHVRCFVDRLNLAWLAIWPKIHLLFGMWEDVYRRLEMLVAFLAFFFFFSGIHTTDFWFVSCLRHQIKIHTMCCTSQEVRYNNLLSKSPPFLSVGNYSLLWCLQVTYLQSWTTLILNSEHL